MRRSTYTRRNWNRTLTVGADGSDASACETTPRRHGPVDRYRRKEPEHEGLIEFMATPPCIDLPQSVGRRCGFRYRNLHAERWSRMVDGVTRCRADLHCAHPDC